MAQDMKNHDCGTFDSPPSHDTGGLDFSVPYIEHKVVQLLGVDPSVLDSKAEMRAQLYKVADRLGLTVIDEYIYQWSPEGVTAILLISESHISIHTWPERGYAYVDIISCAREVQLDQLHDILSEAYKPRYLRVVDFAYMPFRSITINDETAYEVVRMARQAGKISIGALETTRAIQKGKAQYVLIASDVEPSGITSHIPRLCMEKGIPYNRVDQQQRLGAAAGLEIGAAAVAIVHFGEKVGGNY